MEWQPDAHLRAQIDGIPIYRRALGDDYFPILEKADIGAGFPDNWMTPRLTAALASGAAQMVWSTGTNHARMQIIRPPFFLLRSYYSLWQQHPDLCHTWHAGCARISLTTVRATEHVEQLAVARGVPGDVERRWLDDRTFYLNRALDPGLWRTADIERMLGEIKLIANRHVDGGYHLDCSGYHAAHLLHHAAKVSGLALCPPASVVTAYEFTPANVRRYLHEHLGVAVVDLFGSTELGYMYYSTDGGAYTPYLHDMTAELHPIPRSSGLFSLIITSTRNPYMPLVRYRTGDLVQTADGSADPARVRRIAGRGPELLRTASGVHAQADIDDCVAAADPDIFVYQLIITPDGACTLAYTTFTQTRVAPSAERELGDRLQHLLVLPCRPEWRQHIAIGPSGKYAWLIDGRPTLS